MLLTIFKCFILQETQYHDFIDKRILSHETAFTATIKRNSLKQFKDSVNAPSQSKSKTSSLKQQHTQVTKMLLAMQSGRKICKDLFSHESSELPLTFHLPRKMAECTHKYHGTKHDILDCLVPDSTPGKPQTTAAVLGGAIIIQTLRPFYTIMIEEYIDKIVNPHLFTFLEVNDRVNLVFDIYKKSNIKSTTREERGNGIRRRVKLTTKVPGYLETGSPSCVLI